MAITTRPLVPIAMGTSDTEEGRAFHQSRLALYGRWIFLISGAFLLFSMAGPAGTDARFVPGLLYHAIGTGAAGLVWLFGSRARMTMSAMLWLDAAGTWVMCALESDAGPVYTRG